MLAKQCAASTSYRGYGGYQQISSGGGFGGVGSGATVVACLCAQEQSPNVHAASTLCMSGVEELSEDGLPWCHRAFGRQSLVGRNARAGARASLHHFAKGLASIAGRGESRAAAGRFRRSADAPQATRAILGHRLHRTGNQLRQRLFRAATQKRDKPAEKGGLSSLSEAGCGGQHERSFHSRAARWPGTAARRPPISAAGRTGPT